MCTLYVKATMAWNKKLGAWFCYNMKKHLIIMEYTTDSHYGERVQYFNGRY